jgi:NAD(P)-dependent dehydrogenase (short-subunit alcohol dehydrogenase family)
MQLRRVFIITDMTDKALNSDPERKAKVFDRTPMGYMGQTSDIGDAALFLAGDAAKYITVLCYRLMVVIVLGFNFC